MSRYEDFVRRVEAEAEAEGPEAVAQLQAFRDYYRLGRQLAERRRELRWTQSYLAELTGIRQSEISRIERAVGNPTLMTLSRLTTALDMDFWCGATEDRPTACPGVQSEDWSDFARVVEWVAARGLLASLTPPQRRAVLLCELQRERRAVGPSLFDLEQGASSPVEGWLASLDPMRRLSVVLDAALRCSEASGHESRAEAVRDSAGADRQQSCSGAATAQR